MKYTSIVEPGIVSNSILKLDPPVETKSAEKPIFSLLIHLKPQKAIAEETMFGYVRGRVKGKIYLPVVSW